MRKPDSRPRSSSTVLAAARRDASTELVCLALLLALSALAFRIAMSW